MAKIAAGLLLILALGFILSGVASGPQFSVWTHHNDNARTGANLSETQLNTSTVNSSQFGKLFSYAVDADIYAQPLIIPAVSIAGKGVHNVLYVATQNDSVFAFDADGNSGSNAQPLWQVNFTDPAQGVTPVPVADVGDPSSGNIRRPGPVGIMGTPVIDQSTGTMYLVARTKETGSGTTNYVQRLHALDITTGAEKLGGPKVIQASVSGTASDGIGGMVSFNPRTQNQRPGLALAQGKVYIAWGSHDDVDPYHGWVMAYDAATLAQLGVYCATPDGDKTGIWQSGQPPSIDGAGNVLVMTGNGDFDGTRNFGESILKLNSGLTSVLDWFAPDNWSALNVADADLGSSGILLIPGTNLVIGGGKSGIFFLVDSANMGHTQAGNNQIVQQFQATAGGHIHGGPAYWNGPNGPTIYLWGEADYLKAFAFDGSAFNATPVSQSAFTAPPGMPGGFLSISANGGTAGSGILWAALPLADDAENAVVTGVLRAFDASDVSHELWNSRMNAARDDLGNFAKYVPPTIANGRVYMASFSNQINVYGLLNAQSASSVSVVSSTAGTSIVGQTVVFSVSVTGNGPTGTIRCDDGTTPFAQNVALVNGAATCATATLAAGAHTITVSYSGDANNSPASAAITQTVNTQSTGGGPVASSVSVVNSTAGTSVVGQVVVFSASVTGNAPTGTVRCDDGTTPFTQNVALVNGAASCATSTLTAGTHIITVSYSGDANNLPASAAITQTVNAQSASGGPVASAGGGGGGGGGCTMNPRAGSDATLLLLLVGACLYGFGGRRLR